jgi:hypothetical protein
MKNEIGDVLVDIVFLGTKRAKLYGFKKRIGYSKTYNDTVTFAVNWSRHGVMEIGGGFRRMKAHHAGKRYKQVCEDGQIASNNSGIRAFEPWEYIISHETLHDVLNQMGNTEASAALDNKRWHSFYTRYGLERKIVPECEMVDMVILKEVM